MTRTIPKMMVIDGQATLREEIRLALKREGYEVETFRGGASALNRMKRKQFNVVITDLRMHGTDGIEVLRTVKSLYPETSVIIITAYASLGVVTDALREGVHDFFTKPIRINELKASILRALPGQNA
ncbi:MAG: response regulator [Deltaproteobacteria bacterium]|nr:response regulator [Deltaproteobacteria bacterium]